MACMHSAGTGGTETTTTTGHGGTTTSSSTTGGPLPSTESITSSSGSGHGGGTACPPGFNNYCFFAIDVLVFLGAPRTHNNTISLVGWAQAGNNTCRFNPYNANASLTGSTACNSAGVQSYITWKEGVKATATAIEGPAYAQIYADLKASADPALTARDIAASQWGVGQQVVQLIEEANASPATYTQWAGTIVAGETDSTADLLAGA